MPFCPSCKYEYRPDIRRCPDCDVALLDELPAEPVPPRMVSVASFPFEIPAQQARLKLHSHGIEATIANEKIAQTDITILLWEGGVKVLVREDDIPRAREILEEE